MSNNVFELTFITQIVKTEKNKNYGIQFLSVHVTEVGHVVSYILTSFLSSTFLLKFFFSVYDFNVRIMHFRSPYLLI